jgi:hypothetical protein
MANFSASVPVANMQAANETLEASGYGPDNFSVPAYTGPSPAFGLLHCWSDAAFEAAVAAIPNVVIQQELANPIATTSALAGQWGAEAKALKGNVTPGLYVDMAGVLWWVIQAYNTNTYPDPTQIPALIRQAKVPGEVLPWVQPLDQFDAYKLENAFTGEPDQCTHEGKTWFVSAADGAGNNVWEPGEFGWTEVGQPYVSLNSDGDNFPDTVLYEDDGVLVTIDEDSVNIDTNGDGVSDIVIPR